jgi:N12 class adenine-specific DNA methylase
MKATDKLLLAGFERQFGAEKAKEAYRKWLAEHCDRREHLTRLARRLREIGG